MKQLFVFTLGERRYGIDAKSVQRVLEDMEITPVAMMPCYFLGLIYYRGEVYEVVDLASLFLEAPCRTNAYGSRLVILRWRDRKMAVVPDAIDGLVWTDGEDGQEAVLDEDGVTIQLLSPDAIWRRVSEGNYGPEKIRGDISA